MSKSKLMNVDDAKFLKKIRLRWPNIKDPERTRKVAEILDKYDSIISTSKHKNKKINKIIDDIFR